MNGKRITSMVAAVTLLICLGAVVAARIAVKPAEPEAALTMPRQTSVLESAEKPTPELTPEPAPELTPEPTPESTPELTPESTPELTPEPTPELTPEPTPGWPQIDIESWEYLLANASHPIGEYVPELTALEGGQKFDSRAVDALQSFIDAARDNGLSVYLSSSYRGYAEQEYLYQRKVAQYGGNEAIASSIVAPPGTSEHQTGLCCDITDRYYESKDSSLENTALFRWMKEHCAEYGFIVRYPKEKENVTGIIYEPWHFRYVGKEAAAYIMENNLCLEEFLALYE